MEGYPGANDHPSIDLSLQAARVALSAKEYINPFGVNARFQVYEYAEHTTYYYLEAYDELQCNPDATLLDVGCSEGSWLILLRGLRRHTGPIIGVDVNETNIAFGLAMNGRLDKNRISPIDFRVGRAENLNRLVAAQPGMRRLRTPVKTNSIDGAFAMFMLYHAREPHRVLDELVRVTKPGSRIAIATSGQANKQEHRVFETAIAAHIANQHPSSRLSILKPPPRFTKPFDREGANAVLDEHQLRVVATLVQQCKLIVTKGESYDAYLNSLASMRKHFSYHVSRRLFDEAVRAVVEPSLRAAINAQGYFADWIDKITYICENTKSA